jgi:hypothetical protein
MNYLAKSSAKKLEATTKMDTVDAVHVTQQSVRGAGNIAKGTTHANETKEEVGPKLSLRELSIRDLNLMFALPFFFAVAVNQPNIYFVIQLKEVYNTGMVAIGLLVAAFSLCRVFAIIGSMIAPKASHVVGTVIGVVG